MRCRLLPVLALVACGGDPPTGGSGGLNLRPAVAYVVQVVQTQAGDVPLVAGRDALLRVFVTASEPTSESPAVRVRLTSGGVTRTETLTAAAPGTPTDVDESRLDRSWNLLVPAALVRPGLTVTVEVDPQDAIAERDEGDNTMTKILDVRGVPPGRVVVVPVITGGIEGPPRVTEASARAITDLARKLFPFPTLEVTLHAPYTTGAFQRNTEPLRAWPEVLSELAALRAAEGSSAEYLGIVRIETTPELLGLASRAHVGISHDDIASDADTVAAHELGHVWGMRHAPCGGAAGPEITYPYANGATGAWGIDLERMMLKPPTLHDVMGYCSGVWISDFTYRKVMANRIAAGSG